MKIDEHEIDLEFIEQEAEDHLTTREAMVLGVEAAAKTPEFAVEWHS